MSDTQLLTAREDASVAAERLLVLGEKSSTPGPGVMAPGQLQKESAEETVPQQPDAETRSLDSQPAPGIMRRCEKSGPSSEEACAGWGFIEGRGYTRMKATALSRGHVPDAELLTHAPSTSASGTTYANAPANRYGAVGGATLPTVKGPATIGVKPMI